ncbi:MAG: hypothetical protein NTW87_34475 [Planctomycetota bacterium]|nr:hypothetical protein [Planctomycetota bacterium]
MTGLSAGEEPKKPDPKPPDPPRKDVGQWKAPDKPKDDEHWYPEFPDNKVYNDTLINGGFEEVGAGPVPYPKHWAHPDDYCIFWIKDAMSPEHGKVVVLDTDQAQGAAMKRQTQVREALANGSAPPSPPAKTPGAGYGSIGGNNGVSFYSERFACKPKQAYKINFDFKGPSGGAKVWVRGWGMFQGEERRRWETIVNCRVKGTGWAHFEQAFHPTRRRTSKDKNDPGGKDQDNATYTEVAFLRVMLYAYWPNGQYYFDNVKVEEISDDEYKRLKAIPADER